MVKKKILITGGIGFIGINLVRLLIKKGINTIVVDKLTYAANSKSYTDLKKNKFFKLEKRDVAKISSIKDLFSKYRPDCVFHLAAESHVDRSIRNSSDFIKTNIFGTYNMLEISLNYWNSLTGQKKEKFRFLHISTDEVYGSLKKNEKIFNEYSCYKPNSPYAASKASSDHLVRAWNKTYGLPTIITNCSNNFGPYQHSEKFIPVVIINALKGRKIPIYGDGKQIRDWIHVNDHIKALYKIMKNGKVGNTYNISSKCEVMNINLVKQICSYIEKKLKLSNLEKQILFVPDRLGHDRHYALDNKRIKKELNWKPLISFKKGIESTIDWYIKNEKFWNNN